MRKLTLWLLAAFLFASCDNLKTKDSSKSEDDTEETTTKKKKKKALAEDEETTEEEPVKKKKKTADDETDKPDSEEESTEENDGTWSRSDKQQWMSECVGTAEKNVGTARAEVYCDCMLQKAEKKFASYSEANRKLTKPTIDAWAGDCNQ